MFTNSSRIDTARDATTALVSTILFAITDLFPRLSTLTLPIRNLSIALATIVEDDSAANAEDPTASLVLTLRFGFALFA